MTEERMEKELTGYPSIDKPWLKYYSEEAINAHYIDNSVYQHIFEAMEREGFHDEIALSYYGSHLKYRELKAIVDSLASTLLKRGVEKGEKVSLLLPALPETVYLFLALNRIGAVANLIDPRINSLRIKECIGRDCRFLFSVDVFSEKISSVAQELAIKNCIEIKVSDSMPWQYKLAYKTTRNITRSNRDFESWKHFFNGREKKLLSENKTEADDVAAIVYTSGTTGKPKGAMLTNAGITAICFANKHVLPDMTKGDSLLDIMPPFLAYGLVCGICAPLAEGMEIKLIPSFKPEKLGKLVRRNRPNNIVGVPFFFELIAKDERLKDLSYIKYFIAGGDRMTEASEKTVNEFISIHNIKHPIVKGYGMTELSSGAIININDMTNKIGSVGQPLCRNNIMILDMQSNNELGYNQEGEIYITGPSIMKGYSSHTEDESKVFKRINGTKWVDTGDMGYVDIDGNVFISGRRKRMIVRPDGHNVFPVAIEDVIAEHKDVDAVAVIGIPNNEGQNGKIPTACIVFKKNCNNISKALEEIKELSMEKLPPRDVALKYFVLDKLPMSNVGKVDFNRLEKMVIEQGKN